MERQARRAQVLRHAKRIFARKGYHRTNVADIIARARIARGTFYLYFQNKKDLFEEVIGMLSGSDDTDIAAVVEEILGFGLGGVARPELLKFMRPRGEAAGDKSPHNGSFFGPKLD